MSVAVSGVSYAGITSQEKNDGGDKFTVIFYGNRGGGRYNEIPCRMQGNHICGYVTIEEKSSYTSAGMTVYECERETYDEDWNLMHFDYTTITVPENTLFRDAAFDFLMEQARAYDVKCLDGAPSFDPGDFHISN